jgi:hypothetical protein
MPAGPESSRITWFSVLPQKLQRGLVVSFFPAILSP